MHVREACAVRLNLGCGPHAPAGWLNVDCFVAAKLARVPVLGPLVRASGLFGQRWPDGVFVHDLRRPFPWREGSAQVIYSSHFLEHLSKQDGARFLRECHRVLAPGGILRIVVPDLRAVVDAYREGRIAALDFLERLSVGFEAPGDGWLKRRLAPWFRFPHRCMYDRESLLACFAEVGFEPALRAPFDSLIEDVASVETDARTQGALIVEGVKPRGA
jgi:SAM-dependent methyltransferase